MSLGRSQDSTTRRRRVPRTPWMVAAGVATSALLLLSACSSSGAKGGGASSNPSGSSSATTNVTFALLIPLTGPNAAYGKFQLQGAQLAVDAVNKDGGINGKTKVSLDVKDTQALPQNTVTAFNHAYSDDHMPVAISVGSSSLSAILPLAQRNDVVILNGGAQGDELGGKDLLFSTIPLIHNEISILAPYLYNTADYRRAAILYTNDDLGNSALDDFNKDFKAAGGQVVATASETEGATDLRSQLSTLRAANPDVLVLGTYGNDVQVAMDQARQMGWNVPFAGNSLIAIPNVITDKNAYGTIHTAVPFEPSTEFLDAFKQKFGSTPGHPFVGTYYDAVIVAAQAYGYAEEHGYGVKGAGIAKAINELKFPTAFGGEITFKAGVAQHPIVVFKMENGSDTAVTKPGT